MPIDLKQRGKVFRDPRVTMRALVGVLLVANLVAAVVAFKPFGGSADDLTREETALRAQLTALENRVAMERKLVDKVQAARADGDKFIAEYFVDRGSLSSDVAGELDKIAKDAGIKPLSRSMQIEELTGSNTLEMATVNAGFEGSYEQLTKLVNLLDKSPRFFVIENMTTAGVQNGKSVTVLLKIDCFVRGEGGEAS